jgi:hypothetical protein
MNKAAQQCVVKKVAKPKPRSKATAKRKRPPVDKPPPVETPPPVVRSEPEERDRVGRIAQFLREWRDDYALVRRTEKLVDVKQNGTQRFNQFLAETTAAVRRIRVDPDTTLDQVLRRGFEDRPVRPECDRCTFVGACNPTMCRDEPTRILRLCTPNPTGDQCRAVLCFDALELEGLLATDPNATTIPNPALALGLHGGVSLKPDDLTPTLDAHSVAALRWQVTLWREFGVLQRQLGIDNLERGLLRVVILPALAERIGRAGDNTVVRFFRNATPAVLQRMLRSSANMALYLLENPVVRWLALWMTRMMRMMLCWAVYGVKREELATLGEHILSAINVHYHHPLLSELLNTLWYFAECTFGLRPMDCIRAAGTGLRGVWHTVGGFLGDIWVMFGDRFGLWTVFNALTTTARRINIRNANMSWYALTNAVLSECTRGLFQLNSDEFEAWMTNEYVAGLVLPLYNDLRELYAAGAHGLSVAFALHVLRYVRVDRLLSDLAKLGDFLLPLVDAIRTAAARYLPSRAWKVAPTVHEFVLWMLHTGSYRMALQQLYDLMQWTARILHCAIVVLAQRFGLVEGGDSRTVCCGRDVLDHLERNRVRNEAKVRKHWDAIDLQKLADETTQLVVGGGAPRTPEDRSEWAHVYRRIKAYIRKDVRRSYPDPIGGSLPPL